MRLFEFDNDPITLPDSVVAAFTKLGDDQRGLPERAMLTASHLIGGGVMSHVIEHVGDLTHRMSHHAKYGSFYPGLAKEKTRKTLGVLTNGYGFMREHEENMQANIKYRKEKDPNFDEQEHYANVDKALATYSAEHSKLVVYNSLQRTAKRAAVLLGEKKIDRCVAMLRMIDRLADDDAAFAKAAAEYELDDQGNPIPVRS